VSLLVQGKADLLERNVYYYIRDENNTITVLETIKQKRTIEGREYVATIEAYKQTLRDKLTGCDDAQNSIGKTTLTKRSLMRLFNNYNACFGITPTSVSVKRGSKSKFHIGASYNMLTTTLKKYKGFDDQQGTFDDKTSQNATSFLLQFTPGYPKGLSIQLSGYQVSYAYTGEKRIGWFVPNSTNTGYVADYYRYKYNMEYKSVVMPLMLQYSFFNEKTIQPYVGLGVGVHFTNNYTGYVDSIHESTSESTRSRLNKPSASETSFRSSVGVNLKLSRFLIGGGLMYESMHSPLNFAASGLALMQPKQT